MFVDWLIRLAKRTPYTHLFHADGTPYMKRFNLFKRDWLWIRLHHIVTPDYDRDMHDHPWNFLSVVLRGGYVEWRPQTISPCFNSNGIEDVRSLHRGLFSVAFRRATDRHLIVAVNPETWTLFITGPKVQWWGFYTPKGKVYWRDYASCHAAGQVTDEPLTPR